MKGLLKATASQLGRGLEHESVQPWVPTQSLEPHPQTSLLISEPLFSEQVSMGVDLKLCYCSSSFSLQ